MYDLVTDPEEEIDIFNAPKRDYQNQTSHMADQRPLMLELIALLRTEAALIDDQFGIRLADRTRDSL